MVHPTRCGSDLFQTDASAHGQGLRRPESSQGSRRGRIDGNPGDRSVQKPDRWAVYVPRLLD